MLMDDLSIVWVSVISEIEGRLASRLEALPTGVLIPRPTPHWKLPISIQFVCPASVTVPSTPSILR